MSFDDIIAAFIEAKRKVSEILDPDVITSEIINARLCGLIKDDPNGAFLAHFAAIAVRDRVGKYIAKFIGNAPGERKQMTLPGYEHLQQYYVVKRDGKEQGIPIEKMTRSELWFKARELKAMGEAYIAHSTEVLRYRMGRPADPEEKAA